MATYNRSQFILESLKSIQNQTYNNWECLIIDDGGSDNTVAVIEPLIQSDKRFKYLKRPSKYKKGLPGSRNYGLDLSKGDYVIFFDDDDIVHPQNLELCVDELSNKDVRFCRYLRTVFTGNFDYNFDESKHYASFNMGIIDLEAVLKNEIPLNSCAVMWKKECFENHRFAEELMYAEEWELYSRILSNGFKGVSINKILFYGRKHPNSNTGEFYKNDPIRVASKKRAIELVVSNLASKGLLTIKLFKYLVNLAIGFRDYKLVKNVLRVSKSNTKVALFIYLKYVLFPVWVVYRKVIKMAPIRIELEKKENSF